MENLRFIVNAYTGEKKLQEKDINGMWRDVPEIYNEKQNPFYSSKPQDKNISDNAIELADILERIYYSGIPTQTVRGTAEFFAQAICDAGYVRNK